MVLPSSQRPFFAVFFSVGAPPSFLRPKNACYCARLFSGGGLIWSGPNADSIPCPKCDHEFITKMGGDVNIN